MSSTTPTFNRIQNLAQRAGRAVLNSRKRTLYVRRNGNKLFELNMAVALGGGVLVFFVQAWLLLLAAAVYYIAKLEVEVIRELADKDVQVIQFEEEK